MYGINDYEKDYLQRLFDDNTPHLNQQESYHVQDLPQITQGLLGNTGGQKDSNQSRSTDELVARMTQLAQNINQPSVDGGISQREATTAQQSQQAFTQQQQQQQRQREMLMKLAMMLAG